VVLTRGDRFILRAYSPSITIGGGVVLDPQPVRGAIRTPAARLRWERLDSRDEEGGLVPAAGVMLESCGAKGLPLSALVSRAGVAPERAASVAERLVSARIAHRAGDRLVGHAVVGALKEHLVAELRSYHAAQPLSEGMPREEAREKLVRHGDPTVFESVVDELVAEGQITARDRLALAQHRVSLSSEETTVRNLVERAFAEGGLTPPAVASLSASLGARADVVDRMVKLLIRGKILVKVETLVFHAEALKKLKGDVLALKAGGQSRVDVATFKDRFGTSRKYAIPLLEYLDRERVTRRVGESRVVL
jgi:selenocysteine-specific elongation factor